MLFIGIAHVEIHACIHHVILRREEHDVRPRCSGGAPVADAVERVSIEERIVAQILREDLRWDVFDMRALVASDRRADQLGELAEEIHRVRLMPSGVRVKARPT